VISLTGITYLDAGGNSQTLGAAIYDADLYSTPPRIIAAFGQTWPTTEYGKLNAVTVEYVAGYDTGSPDNDYGENVPQAIKSAMKLLIGLWYENREAAGATPLHEVPLAVKHLLGPFEIRDFTLE
jgi:uncharacterized phiE125 gp8 family phage protein